MKYSLLLGIILFSCVMLGTSYSQNTTDDKKDLIDRIKNEYDLASEYNGGKRADEKNANKKAIEHYEKAVKYMQLLNYDEIDKNRLAIVYSDLGELYSPQNHKKALEYICEYYRHDTLSYSLWAEKKILSENLHAMNSENGWKPIGLEDPNIAMKDNDGTMYFYNAKKIKKTNGIIRVWIKADETGIKPPNQKALIQILEDSEKPPTKSLNEILRVRFPFSVTLEEFDCKKLKHRTLQFLSYDNNGNTKDSWDDNNAKWRNIVPNTVGEQVFEFLCK